MRSVILLASLFCVVNSMKSTKPVIRSGSPFQNAKIFDYNVVAKGIQPSFLREAELKHGRLAMLASVILPTLEQCTDGLGINQFQNLPNDLQLGIVGLMFLSEFSSMFRGWENPTDKLFRLKEDYQPGDIGFGVSRSFLDKDELFMSDAELNNGRLAMIGSLGMIVQELVTDKPIF